MGKIIPFPLGKEMRKSTPSIIASSKFCSRLPTAKAVHNLKLEHPDYIHKMPIQNPQVKGNGMTFSSRIEQKQTNCQVLKAYHNVKSVKSGGQIKSPSKYTIPKSKSPSGVFQVLTIHKKLSLGNSHSLVKPAFIFFLSFKPVFPCICCKIGSQQKQSIDFRQTFPIYRHNSHRRPPQPNPHSGLQTCMLKSPKKSYKKHSFTPNEKIHS